MYTVTEEEYWASEMRDSDLGAAADAGEYFLEESGFSMMPTQVEMQQMAQEGEIILLRVTDGSGARG